MRDGTTRMKRHVVTYLDEIAQLLASDIKILYILTFCTRHRIILLYYFFSSNANDYYAGKQNCKSTKLDFTRLRRDNQKCFFLKQKQTKNQTRSGVDSVHYQTNNHRRVVYAILIIPI